MPPNRPEPVAVRSDVPYDVYEGEPSGPDYGYEDEFGEPYGDFYDQPPYPPVDQFGDEGYDLPSAQPYGRSPYPAPDQFAEVRYGFPSGQAVAPPQRQSFEQTYDPGYGQPIGAGYAQDPDPGFAPPYDGYQPDGYQPSADPFGSDAAFPDDDPYRAQYLSQQQYRAEHGYQTPGSLGTSSLGPVPEEADGPLKEKRSLGLYVVLSFLTLGIYGWYCVHGMARDANRLCAADGEKTTGFGLYFLLCIVTLNIYSFYWLYKLAERLYRNAPAYGVRIEQNGLVILLWDTVGCLLVVGPFIAMHYVFRELDELSRVYNEKYVYNW